MTAPAPEDDYTEAEWLAAFRDRYGPVGSPAELRELYRDGNTLEQANRLLLQEV